MNRLRSHFLLFAILTPFWCAGAAADQPIIENRNERILGRWIVHEGYLNDKFMFCEAALRGSYLKRGEIVNIAVGHIGNSTENIAEIQVRMNRNLALHNRAGKYYPVSIGYDGDVMSGAGFLTNLGDVSILFSGDAFSKVFSYKVLHISAGKDSVDVDPNNIKDIYSDLVSCRDSKSR